MRYLGSTIVLRDEACYCRFEGPSSDAVAEVNRQAGLPFDRIVAAVTVNPKGAEMTVYPSIPATVEIKRGRLFGLVVGIAALTAAVTWASSAFAFDERQLDHDGGARYCADARSRATCPTWVGASAWTRLGSVDHVPDTGRSRRERARNRLRPPECPEGPERGVGSRVDEPADPRSTRRRS